MGLGCTPRGVFTALVPCIPMFFSTWETYHTHTLYLGYFNGPTEGLLIACTIMIASGFYGPGIWHEPLANFVGFSEYLDTTSFIDIWISIVVIALFLAHFPECIYNVYLARKRQKLPFVPVFLELTPMAVYTGSIGLWLYSPYSTLMKNNHLMLFCLTMSFVFGRMTTKMILAHLTRQPFPYWTMMLAPLVGGAVLGNLPYIGLPQVSATTELWYLRGYFAFAAVAYFNWAIFVINRICTYLDINCLTITPRLLHKGTVTGKNTGLSPSKAKKPSASSPKRKIANGAAKAETNGSPVVERNLRNRKVVGQI